jgi:hypothetical protein
MGRFSMKVLLGYSLAILHALAINVSARKPTAETIADDRADSSNALQPAGTNLSARVETTWIFDADFEDFEGDDWRT